ncbi:Zinc metallopeptidase-like protein [Roseovarius sp. EC-HK134]|uniref:M48 family metallopeptidase n=1 Tax=unclassified Roseovarius TaxID=2614913 RepID=UPI001259099B|nr:MULTISPECIES: SprT family zinc-dependent metalloprotease [unclassified Roseovarius]VVT32600.1 Zinc metallopeptidase-like protein [Roseovarius sp. EC-HK134]VVT32846.1 Zinc metallopeptidase-like protein [Roseovarius sp. EC-SD190]
MGHHTLTGNPPVALTLRHSARARRISLRVSGLDGRVTLTIPRGVSEAEALAFARSRADWLRGHLEGRPGQMAVGIGCDLPVEGEILRIVLGSGRRVQRAPGQLCVPGPEESAAARLEGWLKARARDRLAAASDHYAGLLGRRYTRLTLRDTRSRWGSCSASGALSYSWRLILAPPAVLDYVAAHEVAHLAQMNHSPAFWAEVARLMPEYETRRAWLRREGGALHRYRFGN